ncbi:MAG: NAD(P)/FAD-dependent oxidoreductase [Bauldia sp.]
MSDSGSSAASKGGTAGLKPHVVIVGAGFGGLAAARGLGGADFPVTVIDRRNYHLFVPLLYQVATAALSPADIAQPIRRLLARYRNVEVVLGEVTGVDAGGRTVKLADGTVVSYDRLILAPGSAYNYFGHEDWAAAAPGPRSFADARRIRERLLLAFERAEQSPDPEEQRALLTTIIVGGGPTGVEMAGSVAELARYSFRRDFRHIDPAKAHILLVEAGPRILPTFPEDLANHAHKALQRLGVTVLTGTSVERIAPGEMTLGGRTEKAGCIVWGAGVRALPAGRWLGVETDRAGRIAVGPDLAVRGLKDVYVIGDTAMATGRDGAALPALAQVAHQQGRFLGRALRRNMEQGTPIPPFRFRNRGNTAIVGRNSAIFDFGRLHLTGRIGWLLWAIVHIYLLTGFDKRLLVATQWLWRYLTYQTGARLIIGDEEETGSDRLSGPVRS